MKDLDVYETLLKERMQQNGLSKLYFEMIDFEGWSVGSFIENAWFDIMHGSRFARVAMVGDKKWQEWAARTASPVKREGIRYFDVSERMLAVKWVTE